MIWVAWRQSRAQTFGVAALVAAVAVYAVTVGLQVREFFAESGLGECLASGGDCVVAQVELTRRFDTWVGVGLLAAWLPLLVGVFWGAPMVARELERGTFRLAWTQGITRSRWLLTRAAVAVAGTIVTMAGLAAALGWLHGQYYARSGRAAGLGTTLFDLHDLSPAGIALAALGIALAAGTLLRRTLPAMAVSLALGFGVAQAVGWLRLRLIEPLRAVSPFEPLGAPVPDGVVVGQGHIDASGDPIGLQEVFQRCPGTSGSTTDRVQQFAECAREAGIQTWTLYQPDDRYWTLQGLNLGMLLAVALLGFAVAWWAIVHRAR